MTAPRAAGRAFLARLNEPVVTDRSVDLLAAFLWACYSAWGIATTLAGLPTLANLATPAYERMWGAAIGALASVAMIAAVLTFLPHPDVRSRIRRKRREMVAVAVLGGFISVYPMFLIGSAVLLSDPDRVAASFLAVSYLGFPSWRVLSLSKRIKALKSAQEEAGAG